MGGDTEKLDRTDRTYGRNEVMMKENPTRNVNVNQFANQLNNLNSPSFANSSN